MTITSLRDELRVATRSHHHAIEDSVDLMRQSVTLGEYVVYLCALYGYYITLEPRLIVGDVVFCSNKLELARKRKMAWLEHDICQLRGAEYLQTIPVCQSLPLIDQTAAVVGCSYVIEGSTLGASIIYRHIQKRLGVARENGGSFIYGYGERTGVEWKRCIQAIESMAFDRTQRKDCVSAAIDTFETLRAWLINQVANGPC